MKLGLFGMPLHPPTCPLAASDEEEAAKVIAAAGYSITGTRFVEEKVSGSVAARHRKGFAKLLDKMEAGAGLLDRTDALYRQCAGFVHDASCWEEDVAASNPISPDKPLSPSGFDPLSNTT